MSKAISKREADLLTKFGFRLVKGGSFETVTYDQIVAIEPSDDGMEVIYNSSYPLDRSVIRVLNIDIPKGKFASDEQIKDLGNAWIFVYYEDMTEFKRNGSACTR